MGQPTPAEGATLSRVAVPGPACVPVGERVDVRIWLFHWLGQRDIVARVTFDLPPELAVSGDGVVADGTSNFVDRVLSGDGMGIAQDTVELSMQGTEAGHTK